ncbi:hypothetical protein [Tropicimonas sp. IMCC34011]|uniref:hypothetical protein n=1 Tax=Tropicimonas sp. IMCC34011 TaxID=2248759 RepID=UPI000E2757BE|nr:hypothetical protein [Tropicimonas sp. IMCC34011]
MLNPRHLLRAKRLVQNPPSWGKFLLILGIIAACLALFGLEHFGLLPDWMQADRVGRGGGVRVQ